MEHLPWLDTARSNTGPH
ncbi:unnamed protein product [Acanthoscelides obtectus]|uniref:Uncharacterized protein n=1 Tax=Acanthoscelides obtectus TaxID=200917 RepID=A0A9P0KI78_ACAOB|nr:unnamed protein product [Acanthoscelides obtectus]CAK1654476.1 hypothetical protein AOBTE_LOCUS18626 [Acanthoscelides obtectus]